MLQYLFYWNKWFTYLKKIVTIRVKTKYIYYILFFVSMEKEEVS